MATFLLSGFEKISDQLTIVENLKPNQELRFDKVQRTLSANNKMPNTNYFIGVDPTMKSLELFKSCIIKELDDNNFQFLNNSELGELIGKIQSCITIINSFKTSFENDVRQELLRGFAVDLSNDLQYKILHVKDQSIFHSEMKPISLSKVMYILRNHKVPQSHQQKYTRTLKNFTIYTASEN